MRALERRSRPRKCAEKSSSIMASSQAYPLQDALAALRLQQEWGIDGLMEDMPWDVWEENPIVPERFRSQPAPAPAGRGPARTSPPRRAARSMEDVVAALARAQDSEALVKASQQIPGVTLERTAKHHLAPVFVEGAPFLLIGDVPNEDEDRYGTLFAGPAGQLLDKVLASIGLERSRLSMAPAIPWRPPGGQRVSQRELEACLPILHRTIALARPQRIVTMGSTAAWMLLQKTARLSQLRGRWHEVTVPGLEREVPLLPLWHPVQLGDNAGRRKALWSDLLLLAESLSPESR